MSDATAIVDAYLELRQARATLTANFEKEDKLLKDEMDQLKQALLAICNESTTTGLRTPHATVTRQLKERFFSDDWGNFKKFLAGLEDGVDLLERRIHQGNFKEFMARHQGEGLPPGVNVLREYDVVVRKISSTSEATV